MSIKTLNLKSENSNSIYFKPVDGQNRFRIVSDILPIWVHFDIATKKATKWLDERDAQDSNLKPKPRYVLWVIDRQDGNIKLAEFGKSVVQQIQSLALDHDYAFDVIPTYDMKLVKSGKGMDTEYLITPSPSSEFTEKELSEIKDLKPLKTFMKGQPGVIASAMDAIPF